MSMHLAHPSLNSNGKSKRNKQSRPRRTDRAQLEHEAWLRKRGLHPDQISARKRKNAGPIQDIATPGYVYESRRPQTSDKVGNGFRTGIMDKLHLEPARVQEEILKKAARVAPMWNKGSTQYITDDTILEEVGKKK